MKHFFILIVIAITLTTGVSAQSVPKDLVPYALTTSPDERVWHLGSYPYDTKKVADEINNMVALGLMPVGIEVVSGQSIQVLFSRNVPVTGKKWLLELIDDLKKVDSELLAIAKKGFSPVDIAVQAEGIYILALESKMKLQGVRIFPAKGGMDGLVKELAVAKKQGFLPVGVSAYGENLWALTIKSNPSVYQSGSLLPVANDGGSFIHVLEGQTSLGNLPFGFMVTKDYVFGLFGK